MDLVNICANVVVRDDVVQVHEQLVALFQRLSQRVTTVITPLIPRSSCGRAPNKYVSRARTAWQAT